MNIQSRSANCNGSKSLRLDSIPNDLKAVPNWVAWRYTDVGRSKPAKIPFDPKSGRQAKPNDPRTWVSFEDAVTFWRSQGVDGVGFVFSSADPFVGVDLDNCRDEQSGDVEPWAAEIVCRLASYTEVSPSGTGVKVFLRGTLPAGRRVVNGDGKRFPVGRRIEVYDANHYFTVTGEILDGVPRQLMSRPEALAEVYGRFIADDPRPVPTTPSVVLPAHQSDADLIERAKSASNGAKFSRLWSGDWSDYGSRSEADLALCSLLAFWVGPDPDRIADLFSCSGLMREKWNREGYRRRTVGKAIQQRAVYHAGLSPSGDTEPCTERGEHSGGRAEAFPPYLCLSLCARSPSNQGLDAAIQHAVEMTTPVGEDVWRENLFSLVHRLKAEPALACADAADLGDVVERWYAAARRVLPQLKIEDVLAEFAKGWKYAKCKVGTRPIDLLAKRARIDAERSSGGKTAVAGEVLMNLCKLLQERAGPGEAFFLACRTAGELVGIPYRTAAYHLRRLRRAEVLVLVDRGGYASGKAHRYRFEGESAAARGPTVTLHAA